MASIELFTVPYAGGIYSPTKSKQTQASLVIQVNIYPHWTMNGPSLRTMGPLYTCPYIWTAGRWPNALCSAVTKSRTSWVKPILCIYTAINQKEKQARRLQKAKSWGSTWDGPQGPCSDFHGPVPLPAGAYIHTVGIRILPLRKTTLHAEVKCDDGCTARPVER
ncbi:hypothetical protein LY76DRAFT_330350 [Colletotrichum caudatum]|nr:hypothetical protein LY76DRAFT_330350 [Colletotrichum caudatum]